MEAAQNLPATPATSPQYNPPPPVHAPSPSPAPMLNDGGGIDSGSGGSRSKFKEFFSDINILDVAISAFIVGGVLYAMHYYKFMMMLEKTGYADLNARVQKMESAMASAKKTAEMNASGNGKLGMRRKRGLITL